MAFEAYVSIKGSKQGQFKGESTKNERKYKWMPILEFEYSVQTPLDAATGQASGKRRWGTIKITKEVGIATPQIYQAVTSNETIQSAQIDFARPDGNGKEAVYQTIQLTNGAIVGYKTYHGNSQGSGPKRVQRLEDLILEFEIEFVTGNGGAPPRTGGIKRFGKWA
ncbi:MAG: type VI secretion system tube protein TssD [Terriglobia bacterium]|jgi:type VI secretion system Hcp family effector